MRVRVRPPSSRLVLLSYPGFPTRFPEFKVVQPSKPFFVGTIQQTKRSPLKPFTERGRHITDVHGFFPFNLHVANLSTEAICLEDSVKKSRSDALGDGVTSGTLNRDIIELIDSSDDDDGGHDAGDGNTLPQPNSLPQQNHVANSSNQFACDSSAATTARVVTAASPARNNTNAASTETFAASAVPSHMAASGSERVALETSASAVAAAAPH